jgi:uncharacterized RDD family membrane protein YckC
MNWFYAKDGHPAGPVDDQELERLVATGAVNETTLVWRSGLAEWKPYGEIRAIPPLPVPEEPPELAPNEPAEQVPAALEPASSVPPFAGETLPYAGFWIRVAASIFDCLILAPPFTLLYIGFLVEFPDLLASYPAGAHVRTLFDVCAILMFAAYQTLFVGAYGATPGKMICYLRVISSDGSRISYGRALARYLCKGLSGVLFIGFIMVGFNRQKCSLHDLLCDTRVIHTE